MGSEGDGLARRKLSSFSTLAHITIILNVQSMRRTEPYSAPANSGKAGIGQSSKFEILQTILMDGQG